MLEVISLAKLTKAQARRRCKEAIQKAQAVFMSGHMAMSLKDFDTVQKIMYRTMNKLK